MKRVTGIGGIFFKAENPKELLAWYERHLGLIAESDHDSVIFRPSGEEPGRNYDGETYASLSAVAQRITGAH